MQCPDPQTIDDLLRGEGNLEPALAQHLRECPVCQGRLDQLTDDAELRSWRDALSAKPKTEPASAVCAAMVEQLRSRDTLVDRIAANAATPVESGEIHSPPDYSNGSRIDHYEIVREIGRGGMSIVLEAIDRRIYRKVALKLMLATGHFGNARARFVREAIAIASIRHSNVITVYEAEYPDNAPPYLVMQLIRGETMREWIARRGGLDPRMSAFIVAGIANGLHAAHQAGVLHRDIKPSNILLASLSDKKPIESTSTDIQPILADFGVAKSIELDQNLTQTGFMAGTPAYASPEQIREPEKIDPRSDVYSLGVTLYEALTGTVPFHGSPQALLQQIADGQFDAPRRINHSVPQDLETICLKAMSLDPEHRYATAADFGDDLRRWLAGEPIQARPSSAFEKLWRWSVRNPRIAGLAGTIAALLVILACGSTATAWLINSKNKQLEVEAEKARLASEDSTRSAAIALEQRELALTSLNDLINKVQTQLADRPGTLKLREELLRTAFDGLGRIAESADQTGLEHATVDAHRQMARILISMGDASGAMEQAKKAIDLSQRALISKPDDISFMRDLANALAIQADLHRSAQANDQLQPILERVLELRKIIAQRQPQDFDDQRNTIVCKQQLADLQLRRSELTAAMASFETLLKEVTELAHEFPQKKESIRDQFIVQNRLASILIQTKHTAEAEELLQKSTRLCESLLEAEPENKTYQLDLASVLTRQSRLKLTALDYDAAYQLAIQAKSQYEKVASQDTNDIASQSLFGNVTYLVYEVLIAMGRLDEACDAAESSAQVQIRIADLHPDSVKPYFLADEALAAATTIYLRKGDFANAMSQLQLSIKLLERARQAKDYSANAPYAPVILSRRSALRAVELGIQGENAILASLQNEPLESRFALSMLIYDLIRQNKIEHALELGSQLTDFASLPEFGRDYVLYYLARAYGLAVAKITREPLPDQENLLAISKVRCIAALTQLLDIAPPYRSLLTAEMDFASMRQEMAFQDLLKPKPQ